MAAGEHEDSQPKVVLKAGASFVGCKPVFSNDSKFLLVASGFSIKVLSVKSGECVRELKGHKAKITGVSLHPSNTYQVYSCSQDQTIIKWDYTDGAILKRYKCPNRLHFLKPTNLEEPEFLGIAQITKSECEVVQFSLPLRDKEVEFTTLENRLTTDGKKVSFGCKNEIVACIRHHSLIVRSLQSKHRKEHKLKTKDNRSNRDQQFTVVECHPEEHCVATGTTGGVINLCSTLAIEIPTPPGLLCILDNYTLRLQVRYNFMSNKKVVTNTLHWHALQVRTLTFTTEGSYLLSGGHECVLVKWQHNTQHRDTLPRLGAPIIHIANSRDNLYYATAHSDNSIQVISSQFRVTQAFVGLSQARLDEATHRDQVPVGLLLDPRTSSLVLNGRPGHLQFYNLHADKQLYSVDIVCQNYISPENLKLPLVMTEVIKADFSSDGAWLATVEWRNDNETAAEQRLKFWLYDAKQQTYTLNTSVELPHADRVEQVKFRPFLPGSSESDDQVPTVVTTSRDGRFKLWAIIDDSDIYRTRSCWSCESVGFYRDMPAGDLAFSEDGSILAVAFDSALTLWDPDSNTLRHVFRLTSKVQQVLFGCGTSSHLVVAAINNKVTVFNLLTCSVAWCLTLKVKVMCKHSLTGHLAIFTTSNKLVVVDIISPEVVYEKENVSSVVVKSAIFVPHVHASQSDYRLPWQFQSQLYFLNTKQELLTLTQESEVIGGQTKIKEHVPETPFSLLLSEGRRRKLYAAEPKRFTGLHGKPGAEYLKEMLSTPAHVLPPVSSLCASFMDSLLITKPRKIMTDETKDDDALSKSSDVDSDMEVDEERPTQTTMEPSSVESPNYSENLDFSGITANMFTWTGSL